MKWINIMALAIIGTVIFTGCVSDNYYMNTAIPNNGNCSFTDTYMLCQGLYTCDNGTATIMTRNATFANNNGCTI